jgi:pyruvate dehydrogenase E1 component alpha subunit
MTPTDHTMKIGQVADRALGLGMPGVRVDGNDPTALVAAFGEAIDRARSGHGPTLLECVTFRFRGHYFGDPMAYIPKEQLTAAEAADPVPRYRAHLVAAGLAGGDRLDEIDGQARAQVDEALTAVLDSPPAAADELEHDVFADLTNIPA